MGGKDDLFQHRVEGIIRELSDYFEIRYAQLTRIRPGLALMYSDLLWQQMVKVRAIMGHEKMFGPVRVRVGDILASRDEAKRNAVMGPIDQASILNELVPEQEEGAERRPGQVAIRNMRAFFTAVDPSLGDVIELSDIWLWWDIRDAADVFNFKEDKRLIERLKGEPMTQALQDHYHEAMGRRTEGPLKREEILSFEVGYLEAVWKGFMGRREGEESFMMVVKRDPIGGDDSLDDVVVTLYRHIAARRRLKEEGGLDDRLREYYAKVLKCDPSRVTAEQAIAHEDVAIIRLREDLRLGLERGEVMGESYDYKQAQGRQMEQDIAHFRQTLPLLETRTEATARPVAAAPVARETRPAPAVSQQPFEKPLGEQETIADDEPLLF